MRMLTSFVILVVVLIVVTPLTFSDSGKIVGRVFDPEGNPVSGARVRANHIGSLSGIVPSAISDAKGRFSIRKLKFGWYFVTADKEQAGYPRQDIAFYTGLNPLSNPNVAQVDLDSAHPSAEVIVRLARKAGTLFGTIADEDTGEPVEPCAEIRLEKSGDTLQLTPLKASYRLLIPADTEVTMTIWTWGYEPLFYTGNAGKLPLRIGEGKQLQLDVRMKRNHKPPPTDAELQKMRESLGLNLCNGPRPELPNQD